MAASVAALWRYPVKSLQGIPSASLSIGPRGVRGDRRYALVDVATDHILSAKSRSDLLLASVSETAEGAVVLALPDGQSIHADDPAINDVLSAWIGRPVALTEANTSNEPLTYDERSRSYEMTFEPENDDAEPVPIPSPTGTFLDLAAVHVLTTGSIARCREARPGTAWDVRRFRPNVLVDLDGAGFPEDAWVGHRVRIGDAEISVDQRTVRCAMPLRAQPDGLDRDVGVFRTMNALHDNHLGVYCSVIEPGSVKAGDAVELLDD